jgi:hypothetical protein
MIALAKGRIGVDFRDRAPKSGFTELGLKSFFPPEPISLNNVHGLMVHAAEPKPQFVAMGPPSLFRGITVQSFARFTRVFRAELAKRALPLYPERPWFDALRTADLQQPCTSPSVRYQWQ